MKITGIITMLFFFGINTIQAQSFAINTDGSAANNSSILDVKSTDKGVLVPRMTKAQKNAINSPATGLLVFQNAPDSVGFHYYDGVKWLWLISNTTADTSAWKIRGNAGINPAQHYIGTNDNAPLVFKTNLVEQMRLSSNGKLGIGTVAPASTLEVNGSIAVGVNMGLAGGTIATPISLANQKTYIGCSPADNTNNFYQLPDPALYPGRIYYIRNNSSSFFANIVTAAGNIFPGFSNTIAGGNTYTLNPTSSVKTIICISDGVNWTVGKID
jgi:hypothetical protein